MTYFKKRIDACDLQYLLVVKNSAVCETCERELPNKNLKTKHGCLWCDSKGDK